MNKVYFYSSYEIYIGERRYSCWETAMGIE